MAAEFCTHCGSIQETTVISHPSGTEWLCVKCGRQVDFEHDEEDDEEEDGDDYEDGICDICGCNLLPEETDDGLCGDCGR